MPYIKKRDAEFIAELVERYENLLVRIPEARMLPDVREMLKLKEDTTSLTHDEGYTGPENSKEEIETGFYGGGSIARREGAFELSL